MISLNLMFRFYSDGKNHKEPLWGGTEPTALERSSSSYKVSSSSLLKQTNAQPWGKNRLAETFKVRGSKVFPEDHEPWRKRILDPGSEIVLKWNRVFIVSCLVALFVDPLYFYLPSVRRITGSSCVRTDLSLRIVVTFLRTIADIFYLLHLIIKFRTAYVAPSSRVFGRGELVMDPKKIARRYIRADFFIDFIATLPLPQVCCSIVTAYGLLSNINLLQNVSGIFYFCKKKMWRQSDLGKRLCKTSNWRGKKGTSLVMLVIEMVTLSLIFYRMKYSMGGT